MNTISFLQAAILLLLIILLGACQNNALSDNDGPNIEESSVNEHRNPSSTKLTPKQETLYEDTVGIEHLPKDEPIVKTRMQKGVAAEGTVSINRGISETKPIKLSEKKTIEKDVTKEVPFKSPIVKEHPVKEKLIEEQTTNAVLIKHKMIKDAAVEKKEAVSIQKTINKIKPDKNIKNEKKTVKAPVTKEPVTKEPVTKESIAKKRITKELMPKDAIVELEHPLYLRGGFNGWGSDNPFVKKGKDIYQASILVAPGNHEFKLASNDWTTQWVIPEADNKIIDLDYIYTLANKGAGSFLFVRESGNYSFTVDFSIPNSPSILISHGQAPKEKIIEPHIKHALVKTKDFLTWDKKIQRVTFSVDSFDRQFRQYSHSTTQTLRDPIAKYTDYNEQQGYARVRSGDLHFDGLFALAMDEMRLNSVSNIHDSNYNDGKAIACECFETGAKWHYVWTRDLSYSAHLSLAMLDPKRIYNSLDFKLSTYRQGIKKPSSVPGSNDGLQIVQDTGSGGSWPISTDRVSWAFGAQATLNYLPEYDRRNFSKKAYRALKNTIEIDRVAAFDGRYGLYAGEQSFLDWREQTYAQWITDDIASIGSSKSLSTNIGHFQALTLASSLAYEHDDHVNSVKYNDWALDLKSNINKHLWLPEHGMYSSMTAAHFDGSALKKYDWLGLALAIVSGVADEDRGRQSLANYPHGPMGAPVIFPQQQSAPIYHNRAIWPFVTAYGLKAAVLLKNSRVADEAYKTLIRSASLNLSNMENLEWLSGQPLLLDESNPQLSGPVINSKRQLWSVAGYLSMVIDSLFGVKVSANGVRFEPFVTAALKRENFSTSKTITLHDLTLHNKKIDITIALPKASGKQGYYPVASVLVNGVKVLGEVLWRDLNQSNTVVVNLGALVDDEQSITKIAGDPYSTNDSALFAPHEVTLIQDEDNNLVLSIQDKESNDGIKYSLHRNGEKTSELAKITEGAVAPIKYASERNQDECYSVSAYFLASNTHSHHSTPKCVGQSEEILINDASVSTNQTVKSSVDRGTFLTDWGKPDDTLNIQSIAVDSAGEYAFQVKYHNAYNAINLGITNGVKSLVLRDKSGAVVAKGIVQMPHAQVVESNKPWVYSTPVIVALPIGKYHLEFADFINMSYLHSNTTYTDSGGKDGPINRFDISAVKVTKISNRH